jgi:F0F1-type ATP synthase assembly protein I
VHWFTSGCGKAAPVIQGREALDLRDRQDLYNGFGDTLSRAVELVAAPVLFALLGRFLDNRLHTGPLLVIALAVFALAGTFVRMYLGYDRDMKEQEAGAPWGKRA